MKASSLRNEGTSFDVEWIPFFLDPSLPLKGKDKMSHYFSKFGEQRVRSMIPQMKATGSKDGIAFSYGGKVANTLNSHRLIEWARQQGLQQQDALMEQLFHQYFEMEGNLGDQDILLRAVADAGLDVDAAQAVLDSDQFESEVFDAVRKYQRGYGVSGVPHFIINDQVAFSGAQDSTTLEGIFDDILQK